MDLRRIILKEMETTDALGPAQVPYAPEDARLPMGPYFINTRFGNKKLKKRRKKKKSS
jgi:hypothetical protein